MITKVESLRDVREFAKNLIEEGSNFHPDDDFSEYINYELGEPCYTHEEACLRNKLMEQCFAVCEKEGQDIYSYMMDILLEETGLVKIIPFQSSVS